MLESYLKYIQEEFKSKPPKTISVRMKSIGETIINVNNSNLALIQIEDLHNKLELTGGGFIGRGWKPGTNLYALMNKSKYYMSIDDPKGELFFSGKLVTVIKGWDKVNPWLKKYINKKPTLEMYPPGSKEPEITWLFVER